MAQTGIYLVRNDAEQMLGQFTSEQGAVIELVVRNMTYIGEACVRIARLYGDYNDITGNLRSSIGYVVLVNGSVRSYGAPEKKRGQSGDGSVGVAAGKSFLSKLQSEFPKGIVLIVCAGMEYAAYVENVHHKRVLIDAELEAKRLFNMLLGKILKSV